MPMWCDSRRFRFLPVLVSGDGREVDGREVRPGYGREVRELTGRSKRRPGVPEYTQEVWETGRRSGRRPGGPGTGRDVQKLGREYGNRLHLEARCRKSARRSGSRLGCPGDKPRGPGGDVWEMGESLDDLADGPGGSGDGPGVQEQPGGPEVRSWPGMECGSRPARSQPGGPGARPEGLGDGLRRFGSPWEPAEGSENRPGGSGDGLEGLELGQVIREPAGRFVSWAKPGCPGHSRYVWEQGCRSRSGRQKMKKPPGGLESRPGGLEASSGGFAGPEAGQEICEPAGKSGRLAEKSGRRLRGPGGPAIFYTKHTSIAPNELEMNELEMNEVETSAVYIGVYMYIYIYIYIYLYLYMYIYIYAHICYREVIIHALGALNTALVKRRPYGVPLVSLPSNFRMQAFRTAEERFIVLKERPRSAFKPFTSTIHNRMSAVVAASVICLSKASYFVFASATIPSSLPS
jgi:hypothetical protein